MWVDGCRGQFRCDGSSATVDCGLRRKSVGHRHNCTCGKAPSEKFRPAFTGCNPFQPTDPQPRILVTGGAGFVGSHLVARLVDRLTGSIRVVDNLWRGRLENLLDKHGRPILKKDEMCIGDLTDYAVAELMTRHADTIFHLADIVAGIDFIFGNQGFVFDHNLRINLNTVRAARANRVPAFVYTATACSFPKQLQQQYTTTSIPEERLYPANPESSYGWSKLMGEYHMIREQDPSFSVGIVRLHNVYGPRSGYRNNSQALPALIRKAITYPQEGFHVWGTGNQYRDFLYVDDAVSAILAVRERGMNKGSIQFGTGKATTLRHAATEVLHLARKFLGKKIEPVYDTGKLEGDRGRVADLSRAHTILGWTAKVGFAEGLQQTFKWVLRDMGKEATSHAASINEEDTRAALLNGGRYTPSAAGRAAAPLVSDGHSRGPGSLLQCGADGKMAKPVNSKVLDDVVARLKRHGQRLGTIIDAAECNLRDQGPPVLNAEAMYESKRSNNLNIDMAMGKLIMRNIAAVPSLAIPTWRWTSRPAARDKWAKFLKCGSADAWACMFGAEQTPRADCTSPSVLAKKNATSPTHQILAVARMMMLQGHRASPMLEPGPVASPRPFDGQNVNVSVHVRGGDACDVMEYETMNNTWQHGRWEVLIPGRHGKMRGHCVHPSVHLLHVQELVQRLHSSGFSVDAVLLATDMAEATSCFQAAFQSQTAPRNPAHPTPRLVVRAFNRQATANKAWNQRAGMPGQPSDQWIEHRTFGEQEGADVAASMLEDARMLAQGHIVMGTMCSNMASLAWNLAVAHSGWRVPYVPLDACIPDIETPDVIPAGKIHLLFGGSFYSPSRRDQQIRKMGIAGDPNLGRDLPVSVRVESVNNKAQR